MIFVALGAKPVLCFCGDDDGDYVPRILVQDGWPTATYVATSLLGAAFSQGGLGIIRRRGCGRQEDLALPRRVRRGPRRLGLRGLRLPRRLGLRGGRRRGRGICRVVFMRHLRTCVCVYVLAYDGEDVLWTFCGDVPVLSRLFSFPDWFFMRAHGLG